MKIFYENGYIGWQNGYVLNAEQAQCCCPVEDCAFCIDGTIARRYLLTIPDGTFEDSANDPDIETNCLDFFNGQSFTLERVPGALFDSECCRGILFSGISDTGLCVSQAAVSLHVCFSTSIIIQFTFSFRPSGPETIVQFQKDYISGYDCTVPIDIDWLTNTNVNGDAPITSSSGNFVTIAPL